MLKSKRSLVFLALVGSLLTLSACSSSSDASHKAIKPFNDPSAAAKQPTDMRFSDKLIKIDSKISAQAWQKKATVLNLLNTQKPSQFVAKVELLREMKYYLIDTSKNSITEEDEIKVQKKAQDIGYPAPNYKSEFIDKNNNLIVFDGNHKALYISPITTDDNAKITAINLSKVLTITTSAKLKLAYSAEANVLYIADLKSASARLFSVNLSGKKPTVSNHQTLLDALGVTEVSDIAWAGNKEYSYLFISHKSQNNKELSVLDTHQLADSSKARAAHFFTAKDEKPSKLFVSPNKRLVMQVVYQTSLKKHHIRIINTGIRIEQHGNHSHTHNDGIKLMPNTWAINANYFTPKQLYHSNQQIAALLHLQPYKSEENAKFSFLNDDLIKQLGKGSISAPPTQEMFSALDDARLLVVSNKYVLATLKAEDSKQPTRVQVFEAKEKGGVIHLEDKQVFSKECPNIKRTAQSKTHSLFACENNILSIKQEPIESKK